MPAMFIGLYKYMLKISGQTALCFWSKFLCYKYMLQRGKYLPRGIVNFAKVTFKLFGTL